MEHQEGKFRTYALDNSELKAPVRLDELTGQEFVQVPDLEENKVYTHSGFLWVSVVQDGCPHHEGSPTDETSYRDCGSCRLFKSQQPRDMIGICTCEALKQSKQ